MSQNWPLRPSRISEAGGSRRKCPRCAEWGLTVQRYTGNSATEPDHSLQSLSVRKLSCRLCISRTYYLPQPHPTTTLQEEMELSGEAHHGHLFTRHSPLLVPGGEHVPVGAGRWRRFQTGSSSVADWSDAEEHEDGRGLWSYPSYRSRWANIGQGEVKVGCINKDRPHPRFSGMFLCVIYMERATYTIQWSIGVLPAIRVYHCLLASCIIIIMNRADSVVAEPQVETTIAYYRIIN